MIVERLDIENVRNIESARLELEPGVNLLLGPNGAGKTTVLEAVHLLIRGRSFRSARTEEIIRHGQQRMGVGAGVGDSRMGSSRLAYARQLGGRTELRRDGRIIRQSSSVAALLPIQVLLPNLGDLVFGVPAGRRHWLDWGTFHVKPGYAASLRSYQRALRHRNALLRSGDTGTLPVWTARVAEFGEAVASARQEYFERVEPEVRACLEVLDPSLPVGFDYYPGWTGWEEKNLEQTLGQQVGRDVKSGATHSGPHRADIGIRCDALAAASVLSRGQGKAVASALRLGQARDLMRSGRRSLFLIDDAGAELDRVHNERLYALLDDMACQIVATSARADMARTMLGARPGRAFHVKQGSFEAV